jgi:hypothetical protein
LMAGKFDKAFSYGTVRSASPSTNVRSASPSTNVRSALSDVRSTSPKQQPQPHMVNGGDRSSEPTKASGWKSPTSVHVPSTTPLADWSSPVPAPTRLAPVWGAGREESQSSAPEKAPSAQRAPSPTSVRAPLPTSVRAPSPTSVPWTLPTQAPAPAQATSSWGMPQSAQATSSWGMPQSAQATSSWGMPQSAQAPIRRWSPGSDQPPSAIRPRRDVQSW